MYEGRLWPHGSIVNRIRINIVILRTLAVIIKIVAISSGIIMRVAIAFTSAASLIGSATVSATVRGVTYLFRVR